MPQLSSAVGVVQLTSAEQSPAVGHRHVGRHARDAGPSLSVTVTVKEAMLFPAASVAVGDGRAAHSERSAAVVAGRERGHAVVGSRRGGHLCPAITFIVCLRDASWHAGDRRVRRRSRSPGRTPERSCRVVRGRRSPWFDPRRRKRRKHGCPSPSHHSCRWRSGPSIQQHRTCWIAVDGDVITFPRERVLVVGHRHREAARGLAVGGIAAVGHRGHARGERVPLLWLEVNESTPQLSEAVGVVQVTTALGPSVPQHVRRKDQWPAAQRP